MKNRWNFIWFFPLIYLTLGVMWMYGNLIIHNHKYQLFYYGKTFIFQVGTFSLIKKDILNVIFFRVWNVRSSLDQIFIPVVYFALNNFWNPGYWIWIENIVIVTRVDKITIFIYSTNQYIRRWKIMYHSSVTTIKVL